MRPNRNPGHREHDHGGNDIRLALLALARIERKLSEALSPISARRPKILVPMVDPVVT